MMPTGQQLKQLQKALITAFPQKFLLEQLLCHELEKNLDEITRDSDLQETAFRLIQTAKSQGWLDALVRAARKENPENSDLAAIAQTLLSPDIYTIPEDKPGKPVSSPEPSTQKQKILILGLHSEEAHLEEELKGIEETTQETDKQTFFEIIIQKSVRTLNIIHKAIKEKKPQIVYVSGKGDPDGNLVMVFRNREYKTVWR